MKFLYEIFYMPATNLAFNLNIKVAKHKIHSILRDGQFAVCDEPGHFLLVTLGSNCSLMPPVVQALL